VTPSVASVADLTPAQLAGYAVAACLVVVLGVRYLHPGHTRPGGGATGAAAGPVRVRPAGAAGAVVDVTGAVRRPGVYRLRSDARVQQAVRRAGGVTPRADPGAINLAAKVTDGAQIVVPPKGAAATGPVSDGAAGTDAPSAPINLNTATPEQLDSLEGVGPAMVQKILEYRRQHGGFGSVGELDRIPGIGPKRMAALRSKVTV
jgi:competence protein ComEA